MKLIFVIFGLFLNYSALASVCDQSLSDLTAHAVAHGTSSMGYHYRDGRWENYPYPMNSPEFSEFLRSSVADLNAQLASFRTCLSTEHGDRIIQNMQMVTARLANRHPVTGSEEDPATILAQQARFNPPSAIEPSDACGGQIQRLVRAAMDQGKTVYGFTSTDLAGGRRRWTRISGERLRQAIAETRRQVERTSTQLRECIDRVLPLR